jgi:hypothetical protein
MPSTKGTIVEQVKRRLKGMPSVSSNVTDGQILQFVGQVFGTTLKTEYLTVHLPAGETIPSGCQLATYEDLEVEAWKDRSRVKLPAVPVKLPMNMGVFHIGDNDCPDQFWIPLSPGQGAQFKTQSLINDMLGHIWYEVEDGYAVANKDISKLKDGTTRKVRMKLVVLDWSKYSDWDILPITPEQEHLILIECVNFFSGQPNADKQIDSGSEPSKQAVA